MTNPCVATEITKGAFATAPPNPLLSAFPGSATDSKVIYSADALASSWRWKSSVSEEVKVAAGTDNFCGYIRYEIRETGTTNVVSDVTFDGTALNFAPPNDADAGLVTLDFTAILEKDYEDGNGLVTVKEDFSSFVVNY